MRRDRTHLGHPFTAIVCEGSTCGATRGRAVVDGLRDCVLRHPHGMLITAGCILGRFGCHAAATADGRRGPVLVVQPCTEDRVPDGPAIWVGPVTGEDDLTAVRHWLDTGRPHTARLPPHLRFPSARKRNNTN